MADPDDRTVHADAAVMADLMEQAEVMSTKALTAYVRSLGITPPDDGPGWAVVLEYNLDLTESNLVWVGPDDD